MGAQTSARFCVALGGLFSFAGLLLSSFATKIWHLYITFGLLVGIGHALMFPVGIVVLNAWFDKRRGLANGVGSTGVGLGTLVFGPLTKLLVEQYGWRNTFRILCLSAPLAVTAALNYTTPSEAAQRCNCRWLTHPKSHASQAAAVAAGPTPTDQSTHAEIRADNADGSQLEDGPKENASVWARMSCIPAFRRYLLGLFIYGWGFWVPVIHAPRFAVDCGQPASAVATVVSSIGLGSLCGRIPLTLLADHFGRHNVYRMVLATYGVATFFLCFATPAMPVFVWVAYGWLCGACCGTLMALTGPVAGEMVAGMGPHMLTIASTAGFTGLGTGVTLGPMLAGWMFDMNGDYYRSFGFTAGMLLLGASTLFLPLQFFEGRLRRATAETSEVQTKCENTVMSI